MVGNFLSFHSGMHGQKKPKENRINMVAQFHLHIIIIFFICSTDIILNTYLISELDEL